MASRTSKIVVAGTFALLAAGGYFAYNLLAAQGQGELAQAPLNNTTQAPPAFIMAVDDSNSMTFERIFPGGDGRMQWNGNSFFSSAGVFYNVGQPCSNNSVDCYLYLFPHVGFNSSYSPGRAIPPLDVFGFARSPTYNAGYFNPNVNYDPWKLAAADSQGNTLWPDATIIDTRADPRTGTDFATAHGVSYDLTSSRAVNNEPFQFLTGMVIPAGTTYRSTSRTCNSSNSNGLPSTSGSWTSLKNDVEVRNNCTVQLQYFPATFYLPADADAPAGYRTDDANRPVIANACGPGCGMRRYEIKPANYTSTAAYDAAIKNFANWFQYHRNRILSMVGSSSHAMFDASNMRVGYFTINNRTAVTMYDVVTQRSNLYAQIYALKPNGGTPNREAVAFLGEQFRRTDDNAPVKLACQRNGGMLFTDGYTNTTSSVSGYGNADSAGGANLSGAPFPDNYSNTIADIAAAYYAGGTYTPLRTGTNFPVGRVPVPKQCNTLDPSSADWKRLDCQTNLHMNFYGVTLGAQGKIFEVNQAATEDPYTNPPSWNANGDPLSSDDGRVIDELWHATINSRGEFINAKTPAEVTAAMRRVLSSVSAGSSPSGSLALTGARIGAGSLTVSPSYEVANEGTDWFSRLNASSVSVDPRTREVLYTPLWEASARLPAAASRRVYFSSGSTVSEFTSDNVTMAGLCSTPSSSYPGMSRCTEVTLGGLGATSESAVAYLRGDVSGEKRNGGKLRDRTTRLGDIVNSTPVISSPIDDYGYRSLAGGLGASYLQYLNAKRQSKRYMVYVGANDGMLHAFDGGMDGSGAISGNGGQEVFAYIPATSYGHMGNLLFPYDPDQKNDQKFAHRYFVDGPVALGDSYYGGSWHTTLVGTTGAGGRGVFALDVTTPGSFGASSRLWEINDLDTSLPQAVRQNIGHVLGKPVIVPVKAGNGDVSWKAIFGNGYNSASGKAVLFLVDIGTGAPSIRMIEAVEPASSAPAGSNGLGNIVVIDRWGGASQTTRVRDGFADTVYGADQRGAVWKFDLRDASNSVSVPVFTTATHSDSGQIYRQPITGGLAAAAGEMGGVLLVFGTGSFSFTNDVSDTSTQSLYGFTDISEGRATTTLTRSSLMPYTVSSSGNVRTLTAGARPAGAVGWYVDLPAGERFVGNPEIVSGIVFMPTYVPQQTSSGCSTDGSNWLFGLSARTGAGGLAGVRVGSPTGASLTGGTAGISLDTGGNAPVKDVAVSVVPRLAPPETVGGGNPPSPPEFGCWMAVNVSGASPMYLPYPCGRQSWRQIQ